MGLFDDLFGGGAEKRAAEKNRQAAAQYGTDANKYLDSGLGNSVGAVNTGAAGANAQFDATRNLYGNLGDLGTGILDKSFAGAQGALTDAKGAYQPLSDLATKYGGATSLYLDSLGANGAAGNQNAVDNFQAGPGYGFKLDQGLDAINRRRAASGMLNSGNADTDAIKFGTGLADQTYTNWQNQLAGFVNPELSATSGAASGIAGVDQSLAGLYGSDAAARLGLAGTVASGQAGANTGQAANDIALGNSLAGLYTGDATNRVGVAGGVTSGNMAANNLQAQGEASGMKNLLGLGTSILGLGTGGGGTIGGSLLSGLGGLFK